MNKMITPEELRERPVLLELQVESQQGKLQWLITEDGEYNKLERMTGKECVEQILTSAYVISSGSKTDEIRDELRKYIEQNEHYAIILENKKTLYCSVYKGKIIEDQRENLIIDYLLPIESLEKEKIWYQNLKIKMPRFIAP